MVRFGHLGMLTLTQIGSHGRPLMVKKVESTRQNRALIRATLG